MSVVYDHEHVFWLIEKTFNITETDGILTYIRDLEITNESFRRAFIAIQSTAAGSAHRIAIQALADLGRAVPAQEMGPMCPNVDEFECLQCKGHNRCESEMDAGFGDYGMDDPREVR